MRPGGSSREAPGDAPPKLGAQVPRRAPRGGLEAVGASCAGAKLAALTAKKPSLSSSVCPLDGTCSQQIKFLVKNSGFGCLGGGKMQTATKQEKQTSKKRPKHKIIITIIIMQSRIEALLSLTAGT